MTRVVLTLLIALWVTSSLSACSWLPVRTEYTIVSPPLELLDRCEPPKLVRVETSRDAAYRILTLRQAWAECNTQHDALINWIVGEQNLL